MRKAILLTAYDRPDYFADVLDSWLKVRELSEWDFWISIDEPEDKEILAEMQNLANYFQQKCKRLQVNVTIVRNKPKLGVLKHPYVVIDTLFGEGYDFVLRTEDDLVVSDGILEYFDWASRTFQDLPDVSTVHGFSFKDSDDERLVQFEKRFSPWVFGTWRNKWKFLKDNWDTDYSTNNGTHMQESGFDWHFNRLYPSHGMYGLYPFVSRVLNIGEYGVHGTPENIPKSPSFRESNEEISSYDIQVPGEVND